MYNKEKLKNKIMELLDRYNLIELYAIYEAIRKFKKTPSL